MKTLKLVNPVYSRYTSYLVNYEYLSYKIIFTLNKNKSNREIFVTTLVFHLFGKINNQRLQSSQ